MTDKASDNKEDLEKRLQEAKEKFDQNYLEFKRKKLSETPCFRSTFLTSIIFIKIKYLTI